LSLNIFFTNKRSQGNYYYYYYIRVMAVFSRRTWVSQHQKCKPFWILLEQEMMGWQWHQLYHMEIICTLLQTDNHASTSPLSFYMTDALPAAQPTVSKHWSQGEPKGKHRAREQLHRESKKGCHPNHGYNFVNSWSIC